MHRLNKDVVHAKVPLPDEPSALVLKTLAWQQRSAAKDAVDMWRCLEIASAAGFGPESFTSAAAQTVKAVLNAAFRELSAAGMQAIVSEQGLSESAAKQRHTTIRALSKSIFGP